MAFAHNQFMRAIITNEEDRSRTARAACSTQIVALRNRGRIGERINRGNLHTSGRGNGTVTYEERVVGNRISLVGRGIDRIYWDVLDRLNEDRTRGAGIQT